LSELKFGEEISEGAGEVVYKGVWDQKKVAIRKLKVKDSFIREFSLLINLKHPNVLQLHRDSTDSRGYKYIITEFIDKESLDSLLYNNKI
jgi:serine/threonine protein kinase